MTTDMYVLGSQLKQAYILSLQTGQTVGQVSGQIIEPSTLEVVAFYVGAPGSKHPSVVLTRDIRRLVPDTVVIDSEEDLTDPTDIVRLQELIERKFSLVGLKVVNESGIKLGKVTDYTVGLTSRKVQKIYAKPPFVRSFISSNLIIDRNQIVDVTNDKITVRDASIPSPAVAPGVVPAE